MDEEKPWCQLFDLWRMKIQIPNLNGLKSDAGRQVGK